MNLPPPFVPAESVLAGVGASSGIAIGPARVRRFRDLAVPFYRLAPDEAADELARLSEARAKARERLLASRDALPPELRGQAGILDAHILLLDDPLIKKKTEACITGGLMNAAQAVLATVRQVVEAIDRVEDPYIRSRRADVEMMGRSLLADLVGEGAAVEDPQGAILIVEDIGPADMVRLVKAGLAGLATERGGHTSHAAIMAQAVNLPAVLGTGSGRLTGAIQNGDTVIVDGRAGHVIVRPDADAIAFYESRRKMERVFKAEITRAAGLPAVTLDDRRVAVLGNMELMEELPAILSCGGEGIGLYRTEFMYLTRDIMPTEGELFSSYRKIVESAAPQPVTIRTFDLGGDKLPAEGARRYRRGLPAPAAKERNDALGLRGIRFCLKNRAVFKAQLRAILRAAAFGDVRLMLPMVSGVDELDLARGILAEAEAELAAEGLEHRPSLPLGPMIEVPATVFAARDLARATDFLSIGTNDLIQYALAIDRANPEVSGMYQPLHPAILRMIKHVVDVGREEGKPVSVCGDMAADCVTAPILVGLGADILSVPPAAIPHVKRLIRMSSSAELAGWAAEALAAASADAATALATAHARDKFPELFQ